MKDPADAEKNAMKDLADAGKRTMRDLADAEEEDKIKFTRWVSFTEWNKK